MARGNFWFVVLAGVISLYMINTYGVEGIAKGIRGAVGKIPGIPGADDPEKTVLVEPYKRSTSRDVGPYYRTPPHKR